LLLRSLLSLGQRRQGTEEATPLRSAVLRNDSSAGDEAIGFAPPIETVAEKTCHPHGKALQVAQRIKPAKPQRAGIAKQAPADSYGLNHATHERGRHQ